MELPWLISLELGLLAIIIGITMSIRSRRRRQLCWDGYSTSLIEKPSSAIDGLQITYQGNSVERLTRSEVVFWNSGTEVIDRNDITTSSPLRIEIPSARSRHHKFTIVDAQIVMQNH